MRIDSLTLRFVGEQDVFDGPGLSSDSWIKHLLIAVNPQQHKQQQNRQGSAANESCLKLLTIMEKLQDNSFWKSILP